MALKWLPDLSQIHSYGKLNTHHKKLRGEQLAEGLSRYSTQGKTYIKKVKNTIRVNQLAKPD